MKSTFHVGGERPNRQARRAVKAWPLLVACTALGCADATEPRSEASHPSLGAFGTEDPSPGREPDGEGPAELDVCFGYRGNGSSVFATIGGIARLMDQYGEPAAVVGTSSGSVAAFLTESILIPNDAYLRGADGRDIKATQAVTERRSFMLKAFPLLATAITSDVTDLGRDVALDREIFQLVMSFQGLLPAGQGSKATGVEAGVGLPDALLKKVKEILTPAALGLLRTHNPEVSKLIHPGFYEIARDAAMVERVIGNLLAFQGVADEGQFRRQNLMYPGVVNFDRLFEIVGVVGDWYAGYGSDYPTQELATLLDTCATDSTGVWWNELAGRVLYGDVTCGEKYYSLFVEYFNKRVPAATSKDLGDLRRVHEAIGAHIPTFVSTSAIAGNRAVSAIDKAADERDFDAIDDVKLSRKNFRVLYFGPEAYTDLAAKNERGFDDVITNNTISMGSVSWLEAMKASGQEPATGRAQLYEKDGQRYLGTGGFVDQLPTKFMRNIGCETTVVFNSNAPILGFANRYSPGIWEDGQLVSDMFGEQADSAESIAFEETDALLCGRWSPYGLTETWEMADNAYHNKLFSQSAPREQPLATIDAPPRACYAVPDAREHKFDAYKLP